MRFWWQSFRYALRWLLIGLILLTGLTLWAVAEPLPQPPTLSADAIIVAATAPLDVEMSVQLTDLINTGVAPLAYLAGSHAELVATDITHRGVPPERLRVLADPYALLSTVNTAGHRRLIIAAPPSHRLTLVRQAQTMGFAVAPLTGEPPLTLNERIAATLLYWRTLLVWRAS
ncbi:hypothetical protein [Chloroflexus sp.]|uniref:hypothetical protein n=1 Tax=Chloroflexus sp. TaxID=1904827 RepID=UPI0026119BB8|nr:hypothetical protein [uncultured Chloroflexus sp.]